MKVINEKIMLNTNGAGDLINITENISKILASSRLRNGNLTVFVTGSTGSHHDL